MVSRVLCDRPGSRGNRRRREGTASGKPVLCSQACPLVSPSLQHLQLLAHRLADTFLTLLRAARHLFKCAAWAGSAWPTATSIHTGIKGIPDCLRSSLDLRDADPNIVRDVWSG